MLISQKMSLSCSILTRSIFQFPSFRIYQAAAHARIFGSFSNRSVCTVHQKDHRKYLKSCHSLITKYSFEIRKSSPLHGLSCSYVSSAKNFLVKTEEKYAVVYIFPYIGKLHKLMKMQLNFAAVCSMASILVNILYVTRLLSVNLHMVKEVFFASLVVAVIMCLVNGYTRKIIGVVSLHEDTGMIQVSYLTFFGKRKDVEVHQQDIAPLLGAKDNPKKAFMKFMRHSSSDVLYLSLKYGGISDKAAFAKIFGTVKL